MSAPDPAVNRAGSDPHANVAGSTSTLQRFWSPFKNRRKTHESLWCSNENRATAGGLMPHRRRRQTKGEGLGYGSGERGEDGNTLVHRYGEEPRHVRIYAREGDTPAVGVPVDVVERADLIPKSFKQATWSTSP